MKLGYRRVKLKTESLQTIFAISDGSLTQAAVAIAMSIPGVHREFFSIGRWVGPRSIAGVRVKTPWGERLYGIVRRRKFGAYLTVEFPMELSRIIAAAKAAPAFDRVVVITDGSVSARIASKLCSAIARRTIELIEIRPENAFDHLLRPRYERGLVIYPMKVVMIFQPSWRACGSASTFDLIARLVEECGFLPVVMPVALRRQEVRCNIGENFTHQQSTKWSGVMIEVGPSRARLLSQATRWMMTGNLSLIEWMCRTYTAVAMPTNIRNFLSHLPVTQIYANHVFTIELARKFATRLRWREARVILDTHDLQSVNFAGLGALLPHRIAQPTFSSELNIEALKINLADEVLFVASSEQVLYEEVCQKLGIEAKRATTAFPLPRSPRKKTLGKRRGNQNATCITIMANNEANKAGLRWFIDDVAPHVTLSNFELLVIGDISQSISSWHFIPKWMKVLGRVDEVEPHYLGATAAVLPVVTGGGIAIKTLEAIAFEVPVIATTHALRGVPATVPLVGHDDGLSFAQEMIRVIREPEHANDLVRAGRLAQAKLAESAYEAVLPTLFGVVPNG
jgi:hypothetical protein